MDDRERPIERETTVIHTDGGGGGGGMIVAIVLLFLVGALAFFFGGYFEKAADQVDVNVSVETPKVELPDVTIEAPQPAEPAPQNSN